MPTFMYVALAGEDRILVFTLDPSTGRLERKSEVAVPGRPAPLAVDPAQRFMFVGRRGSCELSSFQIDHDTGALRHVSTVPLPSDPCFIATDRRGRSLLSAYYAAGRVAVHSIGPDGVIGATPVEWRDTARGAHCFQTDPTNRFAFVPHIAGSVGPNAIFQFRFDESTGHLTPNEPFQVIPDAPVGPRHFCFHPSKDILYFSNEQGCSVTAYHMDPATGTLRPFQTISTLPEGFQGKNTCSQIRIAPSGRSLYAPNRGHNSIACFAVDSATGRLASLGQAPSERVPRAFNLDPDGNFLYAAGLESGRMASYRIDQGTGRLQPLEVYEVGKEPMWVLPLRAG